MRGFGLLQVLLMISVMAGLSAMGYMQWRERSAVDSSLQERQALAQADRALIAYATVTNSLPCPDVDRDGLQDCGATKGYLPTVTMALAGADAGVGVGELLYVVQRGSPTAPITFDLSLQNDDSWRPLQYNQGAQTFASMRETTATGGAYTAGVLTLADFCQRLDIARRTPYAAGLAGVNAPAVRAVAYALAHPGSGDMDGDGNLFDGANAPATALLEDPARRPLLATYNDIVFERSYASLQTALHCQPLIDSINTMALGVDVIEQVHGMRESNIDSANQAIAFAALGAAITAIETTATVLEGISDAGNAAADFAICAATLGLAVNACAAGGIHVAAAALTGAVAYLNAASIAANIAAAVMAGNALSLAQGSVDPTKVCPKVDISDAVNAAKADWDDAIADRKAIDAAITSKRNELTIAELNRTNAITALYNYLRAGATHTDIDGRVQTLFNSADSWSTYTAAVADANKKIEAYQDAYDGWNAQVTRYGNMITNRTALMTQLTADIAALDTQIANTSDATAKAALQKQRLEKTSQLTLLQDPVALQKEYDKAVTERDTAATNLANAQAALAAAQGSLGPATSAFQVAYVNLANAGRYVRFNGPATLPNRGCTSYNPLGVCTTNDIDTSANVQFGIADLFGWSSAAPDPEAKYLRPIRLRKELTALENQLTPARKRETDAEKLYLQLDDQSKNPPPCTLDNLGTVTPMPIERAMEILLRADQKGGIR